MTGIWNAPLLKSPTKKSKIVEREREREVTFHDVGASIKGLVVVDEVIGEPMEWEAIGLEVHLVHDWNQI